MLSWVSQCPYISQVERSPSAFGTTDVVLDWHMCSTVLRLLNTVLRIDQPYRGPVAHALENGNISPLLRIQHNYLYTRAFSQPDIREKLMEGHLEGLKKAIEKVETWGIERTPAITLTNNYIRFPFRLALDKGLILLCLEIPSDSFTETGKIIICVSCKCVKYRNVIVELIKLSVWPILRSLPSTEIQG